MATEESIIHTIGFYNIENLFDTVNNPNTNDDDFLPFSRKRWTKKRYTNKLIKIGNVISEIGDENIDKSPVIVGLAEVENKSVLQDLVQIKTLEDEDYSFIHYDSSDERGVDVALLYKSDVFKINHSETFAVYLEHEFGERDYTRDILLVQGLMENEKFSVLVNHWSSRREGKEETKYKRLAAAQKLNSIIKTIRMANAEEKIIVMGDFNDNPDNDSLKLLETESGLFNPFKTVWSRDRGSLNHNFQWHMFDQILCSTNLLNTSTSELSFNDANIFDERFLTQYHGKFKGQPFRTYVGKRYKGGYSDHFPVYINLKRP